MRKATKRRKTCISTGSRYKTKCNLITCPQQRSCSSKKRGLPKADKTSKKNKRMKTAALRLVYTVRNYIPAGEEAKAGFNVGVLPVSIPCECAGYDERGGFMCEICVDD